MASGAAAHLSNSASIESLAPGQQVGRYVVDARLARGGMGEVWLATARGPGGFQKRVVIKTVLPGLAEKAGYVEMLVKEASLAARLNHPNVVQVFDLGCVGDLYYIAMEHLSGRSLAQMLRRAHQGGAKVPVPVLCAMAAAACDGLAYAHSYTDDDGRTLGLLHRDISPSNLMLTFAGRVALLDFGVATATRGRYATRSGQIKGKFHYLAPERVRGEPHDRRSDIYALGVVLYQCLTLRWPFRAQSDYELLHQIANQEAPRPREHDPTIPEALEQIVMRAMARDPDRRYPDAAVLGGELRAFARARGQLYTAPELAEYLTALFPDAPEVATLQRGSAEDEAPPATIEIDDDIEIVFQASERSEVSTALDTGPPPGRTAAGSASGDPAVLGRRAAADAPDIFPEPTRVAPVVGGDVFGGYARRAGRRRTRSGPAFFGVRLPPSGEREDAG